MKKVIAVCLFVMGMLIFASTAFVAGSPRGVPSTPTDLNESAAKESPILVASVACGDYYCDDGYVCCGDDACCPRGMSIYCPELRMCYSNVEAAKADCGWNHESCWVPVD